MFLLFLQLASSYHKVFNVTTTSRVLVTQSFGFEPNGSFNINIELYQTNLSKMYLFLANYNHFGPDRSISRTCKYDNYTFSNLNYTYSPNLIENGNENGHENGNENRSEIYQGQIDQMNSPTRINWSGKIPDTQIYSLWVVNCDEFHTLRFQLVLDFKNEFSYIDFRNEKLPYLNIIMAGVNLLLSLFWIGNLYCRREYSVPLQQFMCFLPLIRTFVLIFDAEKWLDLKYLDFTSNVIDIFLRIFVIVFYTLFFSSLSLEISGYCTFRSPRDFPLFELFEIFGSSFFFVLGFELCDEIFTSLDYILAAMIMMCGGFLWQLKVDFVYFFILANLVDQFHDDGDVLRRIKKSKYSGIASLSIFVLGFIFRIGFAPLSSPILDNSVDEVFIVLTEISQLLFFWLKKRDLSENDEENCFHNGIKVVKLGDPSGTQISFLQREGKV
ncbi:hypothetical protein TRFO_29651 [Tritrichomonas foetus]|uniref:Intimal thickness related receptor IRP domain-containing protein n=1 Tax=Tritrichomonas foetus TaxID=1144522 RepID=A0A1J4JZW8_9EUKA|nr:hypothetical protein TRFO_29651 [Tritrichomonas foetus]|eukprot:OHT03038.1 hypothetical protein TRFO_29651 [Tritrichomonas foetus]